MAKIKRGGTHNTAMFTCSLPGIFLENGLVYAGTSGLEQGVAQSDRMPVRENDQPTMRGLAVGS